MSSHTLREVIRQAHMEWQEGEPDLYGAIELAVRAWFKDRSEVASRSGE